jgi:hypothetical protein
MFSMSHNNGVVTKLGGEPIFENEKSPHMNMMEMRVV